MDFDARKRSVMEGLASDEKDKSRKGGVDAPIAALITRINSHPLFFTTSSCSGRVSIFSEASSLRTVGSTQAQEDVTATNLCTPETNIEEDGNQKMDTDTKKKKKKKKKGGDWVYVTHDAAIADELIKEVQAYCSSPQEGLLVFRFEPFILALECCTPEAAQLLVSCALSSGFRESGITSMGRRNIVGVRCSIRMEVPIAEDGELLIPEEYLRFLTALANKKMEANFQRTQKFLSNFKDQVEVSNPQIAPKVRHDCGIQEPKSPPSQSDTWQDEISAKDGFMKAASASQCHIEQPCHQRLDIKKDSTEAKERKKLLSQLKGRQMRLLARISSLEARLGMIQETAPGSVPSTVEGTKGNGQVVLNNGLVHRQVKEVACLANCSRRKGDELQIHRRDSVQLVPKLLRASTGNVCLFTNLLICL
jgi:tRNA(Phe) wybutosine-synthesizing methylase Tyw3